MNILFDTNVLIPLISTRSFEQKYAQILRLTNLFSHHIFYHPIQKTDFERDSDIQRKESNLIRLQQFQMLSNVPSPTTDILRELSWSEKNENDKVDNCLLYALKLNAIHFFVTDDRKLRKKAQRVGLQDNVFTLNEFLDFLIKEEQLKNTNHSFGIKCRKVYEFPIDLPFWDSLKESYPDFTTWHARCAQDQRECWCVCDDVKNLLAICIYKVEINPNILSPKTKVLEGNVLKLCTFKVTLHGVKLGERFLFHAFNYAITKKLDYIYLHTHEQQELENLLDDFGFSNVGMYNNDVVYVKRMKVLSPPKSITDKFRYFRRNYPTFYNDDTVNKFIIPIQHQFHERLFPDISNFATSLFEDTWLPIESESNTIKKAYISNSSITTIKPGDVLLFYRTFDRKSIEVIGIVESVKRYKDDVAIEEVLALVSKRTVYSAEDLEVILGKNITLVILFRILPYISPITYEKIQSAGIKMPIQTIRKITGQYNKLME